MAFGSRTVAQRDVDFNVNLGQFRAQLGEADALYTRTTGSMSTAALRLSVKQAELAKAIKTQGAESLSAARKTIALREETERLGVASTSTKDRVLSEERALGRLTRGAVAGSGAFSGLGRSLAFSSAAFLGGAGLVYALRASVKAAEAMQVSQGQLQVSLKDSNLAWDANKAHILAALDAQVKSTAFTKDDLMTNLALFVRRYGDVNKALAANALAADVARGKNEDLATATKQVLGASLGNTRAARQLAIVPVQKVTEAVDALRATTKHATAEQLANAKAADVQATATKTLAAIDASYHGSAAKYLTTSAGKQALFNAELKRSEEIIGEAVLPELTNLAGGLGRYLEKLNSTGKLQKDVRAVTHDMGIAFHDAGKAVKGVKDVFDGLAPVFGGAKGEIKAIGLAFAAWKLGLLPGLLGQIKLGVKGVGRAAAVSTPEVNAFKTAEERPDFGPGGGKGGAGFVPLPFGGGPASKIPLTDLRTAGEGGLGARLLARFGGAATDLTLGGGGLILPGLNNDTRPGAKVHTGEVITQGGKKYVIIANRDGSQILDIVPLAQYQQALAQQRSKPFGSKTNNGFSTANLGGGGTGGDGSRHHAPLVLGLTNDQLTALLVAQGTPGTADDLKALKGQYAIYIRLLGQKGLNASQRNDLLSGRNSVIDQIASIDSTDAAAAKEAAAKAAAAKKKLADEAKKRRAAVIAGLEQAPVGLRTAIEKELANPSAEKSAAAKKASEQRLLELYRKERAAIEAQIVELKKIGAGKDAILKARTNEAAIQKHINQILKTKKTVSGAVQAQKFEDELSGILGQFASNVSGRPGGLPTGSRPLTIVQNFAKPVSHFAAQRAAREAANHYPI